MQTKATERTTRAGAPLHGLLAPELFRALGEPSRLAIVLELAGRGGAASVSEMSACCPRDLSVVSRHLSRLRAAGILAAERRGKEVRYCLNPGLGERLRAIADALDVCCPSGSAAATASAVSCGTGKKEEASEA